MNHPSKRPPPQGRPAPHLHPATDTHREFPRVHALPGQRPQSRGAVQRCPPRPPVPRGRHSGGWGRRCCDGRGGTPRRCRAEQEAAAGRRAGGTSSWACSSNGGGSGRHAAGPVGVAGSALPRLSRAGEAGARCRGAGTPRSPRHHPPSHLDPGRQHHRDQPQGRTGQDPHSADPGWHPRPRPRRLRRRLRGSRVRRNPEPASRRRPGARPGRAARRRRQGPVRREPRRLHRPAELTRRRDRLRSAAGPS